VDIVGPNNQILLLISFIFHLFILAQLNVQKGPRDKAATIFYMLLEENVNVIN